MPIGIYVRKTKKQEILEETKRVNGLKNLTETATAAPLDNKVEKWEKQYYELYYKNMDLENVIARQQHKIEVMGRAIFNLGELTLSNTSVVNEKR